MADIVLSHTMLLCDVQKGPQGPKGPKCPRGPMDPSGPLGPLGLWALWAIWALWSILSYLGIFWRRHVGSCASIPFVVVIVFSQQVSHGISSTDGGRSEIE